MNYERPSELHNPNESVLAISGSATGRGGIRSPVIERYVTAQAFQAVHTLKCLIWAGFPREKAFEMVSREVQSSFFGEASIQAELDRVAAEEYAAYEAAQQQKETAATTPAATVPSPIPEIVPLAPPSPVIEPPLPTHESSVSYSGSVQIGRNAPASGHIWVAAA